MKKFNLFITALSLLLVILAAPFVHAQGAAFIPTETNDPYFYPLTSGGKDYPGQWHLWNKVPASDSNKGQDAGLKNAWNLEGKNISGYTGRGVVIGIVDDGVEGTHEDLKDNYLPGLSKNFSQDPTLAAQPQGPVQGIDNHGTAVAGVAAARGSNTIGGTGAAPFAQIAGLRLRLGNAFVGDPAITWDDYYDAYLWKSGLNSSTLAIESKPEIHIKNHSYGPNTPFEEGTDHDDLQGMIPSTTDPNWGFFVRGNLVLGDQKDTVAQRGYDFKNGGLTLGTDYRFSERFVGGVLFGMNAAKSWINDGQRHSRWILGS